MVLRLWAARSRRVQIRRPANIGLPAAAHQLRAARTPTVPILWLRVSTTAATAVLRLRAARCQIVPINPPAITGRVKAIQAKRLPARRLNVPIRQKASIGLVSETRLLRVRQLLVRTRPWANIGRATAALPPPAVPRLTVPIR